MATIRESFHSLGNKHNLIVVGCDLTRETLKDYLEEEKQIPQGLKDKLSKIVKDLQGLVEAAQEADKITNKLHDRIYKLVDPDTGKTKGV